jgi:predicted nucleotidyltransferase
MLKDKRNDILHVASMHGVTSIRVFGSVARGEAVEDSDVDFLIEVGGPTTPWFPGGLVADLEDLLGCRVDVVEEASLEEGARRVILREAVPL